MNKIHQYALPTLLIVLAVALSLLLFQYAIPCNIGLVSDDIAYISTARNLLAGYGYMTGPLGEGGTPLTHFPPGYSTLLALSSIGADPVERVRLLHAVLFGLNTALLGFLVFKATNRSSIAIFATLAFFLSSVMFQEIHLTALSEPSFVTCMLLLIWSCAKYIERPRLSWAIVAALLTGWAILLRYVGIVLIPTILITLFLSTKPLEWTKQKLVHVATVIFFSILPFSLWLLRNNIVAETSTNRSIGYHPVTPFALKKMVTTMYDFWMPINIMGQFPMLKQVISTVQVVIIVSAILFLVFRLIIREQKGESYDSFTPFTRAALYFASSFVLIYLPFLLTSITFFDAITPLDNRILSVWHLMLLLATVIVIYHIARERRDLFLTGTLLCLFSFLLLFNINSGATNLKMVQIHGIGYNSRVWRPAFQEIDHAYGNGKEVYTNSVLQTRLLLNYEALWLPSPTGDRFEEYMSNIQRQVLAGDAIIVVINHGYSPVPPPSLETMVEEYGLPLYFTDKNYTLIGNETAFTAYIHEPNPNIEQHNPDSCIVRSSSSANSP